MGNVFSRTGIWLAQEFHFNLRELMKMHLRQLVFSFLILLLLSIAAIPSFGLFGSAATSGENPSMMTPGANAGPVLLRDVFAKDSTLNSSLWQINGQAGNASGLNLDHRNSTVVTPTISFSRSTGLGFTGVNSTYEVASIQSKMSFGPPFSLAALVQGTITHGNTFVFMVSRLDGRQGVGIQGNLNSTNEGYYGIKCRVANPSHATWDYCGTLVSSPSVNVWYLLRINVLKNLWATLSVSRYFPTNGSSILLASTSSNLYGAGPFYVILAQWEGRPFPVTGPGPNVANWYYVNMVLLPSVGFTFCDATHPCSMGVVDYGISGNGLTYTYNTTAFSSWVNFTSLSIGNSSKASLNGVMTVQQNLVAYGVAQGGNLGEYWTQDIALIKQKSATSFSITLVDNVWNFSAANAMMSNIKGNGTGLCKRFGTPSDGKHYYCSSLTFSVSLPFQLNLVTKISSLNGSSAVTFGMRIFASNRLVASKYFDRVTFASRRANKPEFMVGGMNPRGYFNDAETVLCGGPGGARVNITGIAAVISEKYVYGGTFVNVRHAWSAGANTAEKVTGVSMAGSASKVGTASSGVDNLIRLW